MNGITINTIVEMYDVINGKPQCFQLCPSRHFLRYGVHEGDVFIAIGADDSIADRGQRNVQSLFLFIKLIEQLLFISFVIFISLISFICDTKYSGFP